MLINIGGAIINSFNPKLKFKKYLKQHFINRQEDIDNGVCRYTMYYNGYDNCPDKTIESCVWFYQDCIEARVYYTSTGANLCKNSNYMSDLMRLFNYINARVFLNSCDGVGGSIYSSSLLYTPRIYMTEDDCFDITLTTLIHNDFYELASLETEDYITAYCPELLDKLSPVIFLLLSGDININQAISLINKTILEE